MCTFGICYAPIKAVIPFLIVIAVVFDLDRGLTVDTRAAEHGGHNISQRVALGEEFFVQRYITI